MGLRTPLHNWHRDTGGKIVDFGGWDMPLLYTSIADEHNATRNAAGYFDVSHMGRLAIQGPQTVEFLEHILTNQVSTMKVGQVRYSLVLNESAGILDDVLLYRLPKEYLLVVNASNRRKLIPHFQAFQSRFQCDIEDRTESTAMIAVQGPAAFDLGFSALGRELSQMPYYTVVEVSAFSENVVVSRTGYTGEDGFEVIASPAAAIALWHQLIENGRANGGRAAGLGARDTLRLEAAMPLYGHELTEKIDPIQARLAWAVKAGQKDFVGKQALLDKPKDRPVRVGLRLDGRRIARENFPVLHNDQTIGWISSGTFSPTLQQSIAMAYVTPTYALEGQELLVDIRGAMQRAVVTPLPFYRRTRMSGGKS